MSDSAQTWEIVNGVWQDTTPLRGAIGDFSDFMPQKAEGEQITYAPPAVYTPLETPNGRWIDEAVQRDDGTSPGTWLGKLDTWLADNATVYPTVGNSSTAPCGEQYRTYALCTSLSAEVVEDFASDGISIKRIAEVYLVKCLCRTVMHLVLQNPEEVLYWRRKPEIAKTRRLFGAAYSVKASMRLVMGRPVQ